MTMPSKMAEEEREQNASYVVTDHEAVNPDDAAGLAADSAKLQHDAAAADSLRRALADSLLNREGATGALSENDSLLLAVMDSLRAATGSRRDTLIVIGDTLRRDSTAADTIKVKTAKKSGIEAPVTYTATDSIVYEAASGNAYLYGDAKVNYQNMELQAERMMGFMACPNI